MINVIRQLKIYRPLITIIGFAVFFVLVRTVFTQSATPAAVDRSAPAEFGYKQFSEILGLIMQIIIAIGVIVGVVFFFWRGKANEQLKEQVAGWKDAAERGRLRIAELEKNDANSAAKIKELRANWRDERKKTLRLQARLAGEDYEEEIENDDI